ncbi:helix-turn-helix domain-containing protein [Leptolyngbya sp. FACHB-671]|uniref:helix-turn-helix domain-containing protein n=1 Tax=Leptolyngbya sp. FACHB-671 TaxID=2692812 RepID=UPI0016884063|nr:helix-turn-helix domain-containing protein [Leptolyngbya sp. FACHB-671]MBD2070256.1 helix-turn-helix domain-containing protein [Leptolyngbya sp. FACHB-671]
MNSRPLHQREQELIRLYSRCRLGMSPQQFYAKWQVSYEAIAAICARSPSTVHRWFGRGRQYRRPLPADLRHLALMDFLLEHFEEIPEDLRQVLCALPPHEQNAPDA